MIKFKSSEIRKEFFGECTDGEISFDPRLRFITYAFATYAYTMFKVDVMVIDVLRTQEQQNILYLSHPDKAVVDKYKQLPWTSHHQYGRGVDVVILNGADVIVDEMLLFLNSRVKYGKDNEVTALWHTIPEGHVHIQVRSNIKNETVIH